MGDVENRPFIQGLYLQSYGGRDYNNISFGASYRWDDEGRMTPLQFP
jgi:hypothetical protein